MKPARPIITAIPLGNGSFSVTADVTGPGDKPDPSALMAILRTFPQTIQKLEAAIGGAESAPCQCAECAARTRTEVIN
jgi:hypothetical protein